MAEEVADNGLSAHMTNKRLDEFDTMLKRFVGRFEESGVLCEYDGDLVRRQDTDCSALDAVYAKLPGKFPPLYERLVLTYRWYRSEVNEFFDIFGNPPGAGLDGLSDELYADKNLWEACIPNGYLQFGSGPSFYDPLCFDLSRKTNRNDYAIVQLDHEQILCNSRIKVVQILAPSFESLVLSVIA